MFFRDPNAPPPQRVPVAPIPAGIVNEPRPVGRAALPRGRSCDSPALLAERLERLVKERNEAVRQLDDSIRDKESGARS